MTNTWPDVGPAGSRTANPSRPDDSPATRRRIGIIWGLLFFNGLPWIPVPTVVPISQRVSQALTMGALALALLLALSLNRSLLLRPNIFLTLFTALAALSLMTSVRGMVGVGSLLRCGRLFAFLSVLWLLTPWWGRRDLLIARAHFRALLFVWATVVVGIVVAPSYAFSVRGRLSGALWPIWPTAVAHFAALAAGISLVSWFSGLMPGRRAALFGTGGFAMVLLTQTRIAMVGLVAGLVLAALTLFFIRQRVRRAATIALVVVPLAVLAFLPALTAWVTRGQSAQEISSLTGRRNVWNMLLDAPRSEFNQWFGYGLSDKGFSGLPIDNSWLAIYQDQGLIGAVIVGCVVLFLFVAACIRSAGPARALAMFIVVYVAIDSYTEVGLGDASTYLLDLAAAASLLVADPDPEDDVAVDDSG